MLKKVLISLVIILLFLSCESFIDSVTNTASALSEGLVAYYPFNGDTLDASGNANHATNNGAILSTDRFGQMKAYDFDGSDYMTIPIVRLGSTFTISTWINAETCNDLSGMNVFIAKARSSVTVSYAEFLFFIKIIDDNPTDVFFIKSAFKETSNLSYNTADKIELNTWYHIVTTYDGSINKIYINSLLKGLGFISDINREDESTAAFTLGAVLSSDDQIYFDGRIDDVRIYNRALSAAEVKALYDSEKP